MLPLGASKGAGLKHLLDILHIDPANVLALGDGENDIEMLEMAGFGVANMVPVMFSAAGNHPRLPAASAISIATMVGYCGILVAPSSIGFLAEHMGFRPTYAALSLLLVVVALLAGRAADADRVRKLPPVGVAARSPDPAI